MKMRDYIIIDNSNTDKNYALSIIDALGDEKKDVVLWPNKDDYYSDDLLYKLRNAVYEKPNIGLAGYNSIINSSDSLFKQVLVPESSIIYIKYDAIHATGIDIMINSKQYTVIDIALSALKKGYTSITIPSLNDSHLDFSYCEINEDDKKYIEEKYHSNYLNLNHNPFLVNAIDEQDRNKFISVLEVGCDLGANLLEIKNKYNNAFTYGIDINRYSIDITKCICTNAKVADIENSKTIRDISKHYDYILFGDVLEHLRDPETVLKEFRKLLVDGGKIIASIPNLMHISVMKDLILNGNFTYTDRGLLDRTHIHLFTKNEIVKMCENAGFSNIHITSLSTNPSNEDKDIINWLVSRSDCNIGKSQYTTFQYLCILTK